MDVSNYGESLLQVCKRYFQLGKFAEAVNLGNKAIEWFEAQGDKGKVCETYRILGSVYATSNDEIKAANSFYSAIILAGKIGDNKQMWKAYNNVAVLYYFLGDKETALEYVFFCKEAFEKYSDPNDPVYYLEGTVLYSNCADMAFDAGDFDNGWTFLDKAEEFLSHVQDNDDNDLAWEISRSIEVLRCFNTYRQQPTPENMARIEETVEAVWNMKVVSANYWNFVYTLYQNLERVGADELMRKVIAHVDGQLEDGGEVYWLKQLEAKMDFYSRVGERDNYAKTCAEYMDMMKKDKRARLKEKAELIDMNFKIMDREMTLDKDLSNSMIDSLTGLGNRRKLELDSITMADSIRDNEDESILVGMIDMDFFKEINDTFGHIKGDDYLMAVSHAINQVFAGKAYGYRFGGDEFVILGKNLTAEEVSRLAKQLKGEIDELALENPCSKASDKLTLSQGYVVTKVRDGISTKQLLELADRQLYQVKKYGRNGYMVEDLIGENRQ